VSDAPTELSRRLVELSELTGGLAHELRNPLSTIMINLKLLAEDLIDPSTEFEDVRRRALIRVDSLRREAERLQGIFDDFLRLTNPFRLHRSAIDVVATVNRLAEFYEPVARSHGLSLTVDACRTPLVCEADENLLRQALLNLLINAQQATRPGGSITLSCAVDGQDALVSVRDTGAGIAPEAKERVFRPFFSTKQGGSGLGLPLTQRIVQEHGGTLTFDSEVGTGTTFHIRLPRT
jgi:signal transduction histidine kinase